MRTVLFMRLYLRARDSSERPGLEKPATITSGAAGSTPQRTLEAPLELYRRRVGDKVRRAACHDQRGSGGFCGLLGAAALFGSLGRLFRLGLLGRRCFLGFLGARGRLGSRLFLGDFFLLL